MMPNLCSSRLMTRTIGSSRRGPSRSAANAGATTTPERMIASTAAMSADDVLRMTPPGCVAGDQPTLCGGAEKIRAICLLNRGRSEGGLWMLRDIPDEVGDAADEDRRCLLRGDRFAKKRQSRDRPRGHVVAREMIEQAPADRWDFGGLAGDEQDFREFECGERGVGIQPEREERSPRIAKQGQRLCDASGGGQR